MAELTFDVPDKEEESFDVPDSPKKRISNPGKQALASVADLVTELPGLAGLVGAGSQAGFNYLTDGSNKSFTDQFIEASSKGIDANLLQLSKKLRNQTNEFFNIQEPTSTEDIIARNAALFLPIPGLAFAKGASRAAKIGSGALNVALPTVKRGTKASMATRGAIQGSISLGIDQGVSSLLNDPVHAPLIFSDSALKGGMVLPKLEGGTKEDTFDVPPETTFDIPEEETFNVPNQSFGEATQDQLDRDAKLQKEKDWEDIRNMGIIAGALAGGAYLTNRLTGVKALIKPPKPSPAFTSGKYAHEAFLDKGRVADNVFEEMGVDDITREAVDNTHHPDVSGTASEAVIAGRYGQGFDNAKWPSHSATVLDTDEAVLRQAGKDQLFNDAMKAQSELAAIRNGKREPSLWRKGITDKELDKTVAAARADDDIAALMDKHAQNYRADLEYEVHRGFSTPEQRDKLLRVFGDINAGEVGTYMPFYGKSPADIAALMSRKFLGINTKRGDTLKTVAEYQARGGGTATKIANAGEAMKRHRLHNTAYVNEELYKNSVLSKMAGVSIRGGEVVRQIVRNGKFVKSRTAMDHSLTGRGTHLLAIGDDLETNPNNVFMRAVTDDPKVKLADQSINDLRNEYGKNLVTVHHQGKLFAYNVPDAGVRAAMDLSPKLGKILEFNNHWKNVFTKFTTGDFSLFAPISHGFSAQQVASTTVGLARKEFAEAGKSFPMARAVGEGAKSIGRSLGGSRDILLDQSAGILADYLARAIATNRGWGKNAINLQKTLHNRYSNSLLSKVRSETGRTTTGIGSTETTLQGMLDEYGKTFSDFYGAEQMGVVKNIWKAFNNAANEGPAYGVIQHEIGKSVQEGKQPNIAQIRKAVEEGKSRAGDMSRRGTSAFIKGVNASIPFSSAMLQSWNALGSAAKYDWKAFAVGAGALIGAPTLMELGMNAGLSKSFPEGFPDPSGNGKMWTYDDYYWNGYTTQQRADNMILFVPGKPPWEAIVMPISPEWSLMRSVVMESADALFNLSATGNIKTADAAGADASRWQVGRDQFLASLHRVLDLPLPPWLAAAASLGGLDIRAGFNIRTGENPEAPETNVNFLEALPLGTGERITGRMGRTRDVNGYHDKNMAAAIKDIFGAGGTAYVAFADAINAGIKNTNGSITRGLEQGLESILDSSRRQARYLQPLPMIGGKTFKTSANDEIAATLHGKRQALLSLSNDAKVLKGGEGYIRVGGRQVPVDTIVPTNDPIRQELAAGADVIKNNIAMLDKTIAGLRGEIAKTKLATNLGSLRKRQDIIDGKQMEIQAYKAQQLGALHTFEDQWSEILTRKYNRDITVNLSGGVGKTIAKRD